MTTSTEDTAASAANSKFGDSKMFKTGLDKLASGAAKAQSFAALNANACLESLAAATKTVSDIRIQAVELPQSVLSKSADAARSLGQAKTVSDLVNVYEEFANTMLKLHLNELDRASKTVLRSVSGTFDPLRARIEQMKPAKR